MIVINKERFFTGDSCGVILNQSFQCALVTDRLSAVVSTFAGEWDGNNDLPIAEAVFQGGLPRRQIREIHGMFLEELDRCGTEGLDLAGAIEKVFGQARDKKVVVRYKNNAAVLLASRDSRTEGSLKGEARMMSHCVA